MIRILFAVAIMLGTSSLAAQELDKLPLQELIKLAEKEGKVTIYAFTSRIARIEQSFEKLYPKVDVVTLDMNSTQMIARLKAEDQAKIGNADVAYISDAPVVYSELVTSGILQNYVPEEFKQRVPAAFQQPLLANRLSTKVIMYNEEANPNGAPIKNLWDMTKPEWRGRVVMVDPAVRGDYLDFMAEVVLRADQMAKAYEEAFGTKIELGKAKNAGEKWILDLIANKPVMLANTDLVNDAIGKKGQARPPIGIATYSDRRDNASKGWALQVANSVSPASGIVFPANLAVVRGTKNPAAARLLIHFMMGDASPTGGEGFAPFYVPGDYATRTDIRTPADAVPLDRLNGWSIDPVKTAAIRKQVGDMILSAQ